MLKVDNSKQNKIVNARPTKALFISMLIKDIALSRAIIDLVDNSVDGARRLRPDGNFDGLWVALHINGSRFSISDNCGGMDVEVARNYAFRFGRSADAPRTLHSVGQFGVGMKRALFKLGNIIEVKATSAMSQFVLPIDVESWQATDDWEFEFTELEEGLEQAQSDCGTTITVTSLNDDVSELLALENYRTRLSREIEEAHVQSMDQGINISINGLPLDAQSIIIYQSEKLLPACKEFSLEGKGSYNVDVKIYAGLGEAKPGDAGWYIFCNGRMLLRADQTLTTGWGDGEEATVPKYHNDFARFRGYAFFDSEDAGLLPWNTTKTGVDADSPRYRSTRLAMITLMRPVLSFLRKLASEDKEEEGEDAPLEVAVKELRPVRVSQATTRPTFNMPEFTKKRTKPKHRNISYAKPLVEIERIQEQLGVSTLKEVGERTFEYYLLMECEE